MADFLSVEVVEEAGATVAHVPGEVDLLTCALLCDAVEPYLGPRQTVVLDLSDVTFIDSQVLQFLVQARGRLTEDGGSLVLRNPLHRGSSITEMSDVLAKKATAPKTTLAIRTR